MAALASERDRETWEPPVETEGDPETRRQALSRGTITAGHYQVRDDVPSHGILLYVQVIGPPIGATRGFLNAIKPG